MGSMLDDVNDRTRAHLAARDWWLYRSMFAGERDGRVELERAESPRAREALRAYELVQQTMDIGGADAVRWILPLLAGAPGDKGPVAVGTGPLEDLINDHGEDTLSTWSSRRHGSPRNSHRLSKVWLSGREPSLRIPQID